MVIIVLIRFSMNQSPRSKTLACLYFFTLLITFANSLDSDQARQNCYQQTTMSVARGFILLKPTKIFGELRDIRPCYFTFQIANDKGAEKTAQMRRLVCAFVLRNQEKSGFLMSMPIMMLKPRPGYTCMAPCMLFCLLIFFKMTFF